MYVCMYSTVQYSTVHTYLTFLYLTLPYSKGFVEAPLVPPHGPLLWSLSARPVVQPIRRPSPPSHIGQAALGDTTLLPSAVKVAPLRCSRLPITLHVAAPRALPFARNQIKTRPRMKHPMDCWLFLFLLPIVPLAWPVGLLHY
jgi:hypothetical protein